MERLVTGSRPRLPWMSSAILALVAILILPGLASAASFRDPVRISRGVALAATVDDRDHVHVVTANDDGLYYNTNASGTWRSVRVAGQRAAQPSIALAGGHVYIAFARLGETAQSLGLRLITNASGGWHKRALTDGDDRWPSLRMRSDRYHIAYRDRLGIRYLTNQSGSIVDQRVWSRGAQIDGPFFPPVSLALGSDGRAHIAFTRETSSGQPDGVTYATNAPGPWVLTRLTSSDDQVDRIVIDGAGHPRVGYDRLGTSETTFRVATINGATVTQRTLPGTGPGTFTLDDHDRIELLRRSETRVTWRAERSTGWSKTSWSARQPDDLFLRASDGRSWVIYDRWSSERTFYGTVLRVRR